jgi:hypothetical protein
MRDAEYHRLKKRIQQEYDEKIKALDMVFRISGGGSPAREANTRSSKGAVGQAVRAAIQKMSGNFVVRDIENQLKSDDPTSKIKRASISSTLKRLADDDEIKLVEEGKGNKGSIFHRK